MEDTKSKFTRIEAKNLSDFKNATLEPLRYLLLNYVEANTNQITLNVKKQIDSIYYNF